MRKKYQLQGRDAPSKCNMEFGVTVASPRTEGAQLLGDDILLSYVHVFL